MPSSASAVSCEEGWYNNGLSCTLCPLGSSLAAGSQSILSCTCNEGLVRPVITSYITTSPECKSTSSHSPSQTVHAGFFRQNSGGITGEYCTIEIVTSASVTVYYVPSKIDNRRFFNSLCSFVDDTRRCSDTYNFDGSMSYLTVTPAKSANFPGASQMVRIVYEPFTFHRDVSDFSLFWYAHGDTFSCKENTCEPGHWKGSADCVACTTSKYKADSGVQICDDCGRGWFSTVTGATSAADCQECGSGTMPNAKHDGCVSCPLAYDAHTLTEASALGSVYKDCIDLL